MNTKYTIKNFRVFDSYGATIDLKPLTILTGCNSSGKSSIVKSLLLLCEYFSSLKQDKKNGKKIVLIDHELDFTKKPHNRLGKFSKVINSKSDEKSVAFEIQVHSLMLGQNVNIELVFEGNNDLFNGYLAAFIVKKIDGTIIYSSKVGQGSTGNLYSILPEFIRFVYTQHFFGYCQSAEQNRTLGLEKDVISDSEFEELVNSLKLYVSNFKQTYGREVLLDINRWNNINRHSKTFLQMYSDGKPEIIEKVKETGILYYLPVFDELLGGDKVKSIEFLTQCINDAKVDGATKWALGKILDDYRNDPCNDFLSYYKEWERDYLSEYKVNAFPVKGKCPKLFSAYRRGLNANQIIFAPHNSHTISSLNWDDDIHTPLPEKSKEEEIAEWEAQPLDFSLIYEALAILSRKFMPTNDIYYSKPNEFVLEYLSRTEYLFFKFVEAAIEEIVVDATPEAIQYVSSSIINVQRLYPVEADDEFTELLKRYLNAKRNLPQDSDYIPDTFFNKWIGMFQIGKRISIDVDMEGLGITLKLHKDDSDKEGSLLADSGYGITQLFATLLNIEVAIMERKVSKVLADDDISAIPSVDKKIKKYSVPTIAIEEPEIHLHPRFQSMLADMFFEAYNTYGIQFIIETHSEYIIRKFQLLVAGIDKEEKLDNEDISVLYVYSPNEAERTGEPQIKTIGICSDGYLNDSFGSGFFDESTSLSKQLM